MTSQPLKPVPEWQPNSTDQEYILQCRMLWYYIHVVQRGERVPDSPEVYEVVRRLTELYPGNNIASLLTPPVEPITPQELAARTAGLADRIDRLHFFMGFARHAAMRSTCLTVRVGAVIVVENRVVCQGYNGSPAGTYHCTDIGICRKELMGFAHKDCSVPGQVGAGYEASRSVHAEQAAICQAAKLGIKIDGGTVYVTRKPCVICTRLMLNAGIKLVYHIGDHEGQIICIVLEDEFL